MTIEQENPPADVADQLGERLTMMAHRLNVEPSIPCAGGFYVKFGKWNAYDLFHLFEAMISRIEQLEKENKNAKAG